MTPRDARIVELRSPPHGLKMTEIAAAVGCSIGTVSRTLRAAGLTDRLHAGRKKLGEPSKRDQAILALLKADQKLTKAEVARRFGLAKQRVSSIVKRWAK
jgi:DNA-directed RNA polymerase specialized sigma subunit